MMRLIVLVVVGVVLGAGLFLLGPSIYPRPKEPVYETKSEDAARRPLEPRQQIAQKEPVESKRASEGVNRATTKEQQRIGLDTEPNPDRNLGERSRKSQKTAEGSRQSKPTGKARSSTTWGTLEINTAPWWAEVVIDGESRGETPWTGDVEIGLRKIALRPRGNVKREEIVEIQVIEGQVVRIAHRFWD